MIKLHRKSEDPSADQIEKRFNDLVLSYKTVISQKNSGSSPMPRIEDGDAVISGTKEIAEWLQELEEELTWQRSLSGDGCYIDPESGNVC